MMRVERPASPRNVLKNCLIFAVILTGLAVSSHATRTLLAQGPPQLPSQAAERLGELEVIYEDSNQGARLSHFLNTSTERLQLQFTDEPPDLVTGTHIRARGVLKNAGLLELSSKDVQVDGGSRIQTLRPQATTLASSNTFGNRKTIVILVNFLDNQSVPYTPSDVANTMFGTVSNFYQENSYGQTWLTGDVYGWFNIAMNSTTCDTATIATLAEQAAVNAGAVLSNYTHRVYAFPQIGPCTFWGRSTVGGNPTKTWVNGSFALQVAAHEFGHSLGLHHSHSQPCDVGGCTTIEYGDDHDIMGNTSSTHMTAFQKERLGWLNYGGSPATQTISTPGTYWIEGYESAGSSPKALKVLKSTDVNNYKTWYYVEVRTAAGFDSYASPGVLVHTGAESSGTTSYQTDLAPTNSGFDSVLDSGQTFTDSALGLTITTLSASAAGAFVDIEFAATPCSTSTPTVTLSPGSTVTTQPGVPVNYSVTVKNNDGSSCSTSDFSLTDAVPSGWMAVLPQPSVSVGPGASTSATLTLTAPAGASGMYSFNVMATRSGAPSGSASGNVMLGTQLDVAVGVTLSGGNYTVAATVRTGTTAVAGAAVTVTIRNPVGSIVSTLAAVTASNGVATVKYRPKGKDLTGTYSVQVAATSGLLAGSGTGTFIY